MVEVEANEFRIAVRVRGVYSAGPWPIESGRCSRCGAVHEHEGTKGYPARYAIVRDASKRPRMQSGLAALFCERCHEANQEYLERKAGIPRGSSVKMDVFGGVRVLTVAEYYDEETFIDEEGYVRDVCRIEKVLGRQATIFDFVAKDIREG